MSEWVILELSSKADGEDPDIIRRAIRRELPGAEVFVPAVTTQVGGDKVHQYLWEGYAFVRRDTYKDASFRKLEHTNFIQTVLRTSDTTGRLAVVQDTVIDSAQQKILEETNQGIEVGDLIVVTSGPYRALTAMVIEDLPECDSVQVYIRLYSKEAIVTLPRAFLRLVKKDPVGGYKATLDELQRFAVYGRCLAGYDGDRYRFFDRQSNWQLLENWSERLDFCFNLMALNEAKLKGAYHLWNTLVKHNSLNQQIESFSYPAAFDGLKKKSDSWMWLRAKCCWMADYVDLRVTSGYRSTFRPHALYTRWSKLNNLRLRIANTIDNIHYLQKYKASLESPVIEHVLIDGLNLAYRCFYAPGMSTLVDSRGRPTGAIVGFLRSLVALRKRYPEARMVVCWDGSTARRRAVYADYKGNRNAALHKAEFDQVAFLRDVLPSLGVEQAWNDEAEADDIIAALVTGSLKASRKTIFTTDRDLLQLVDELTVVHVPAVGTRKEQFLDVDAVIAEYGVRPEKLLQLKAFLGDDSDNLPGVVRVPSKVLTALIRSYETVDGVYASGMVGLTAGQCQRIRDAEAQVRINLSLMTLESGVKVLSIAPVLDLEVAEKKLSDINMNVDRIRVLFEKPKGFSKTT